MQLASDCQAAAWIRDRLHPFARDVGSIVPEGFEAYARIFHPPYRRVADGTYVPVRWQGIAAANNRSIEAEMKVLDMSSDPTEFSTAGEPLWDQQSPVGCIPHEIMQRLISTLRRHTATAGSCMFAVWEGWGDLGVRRERASMFALPGRNYVLLRGAIDDALVTLSEIDRHYRSPNIWWPEDQAWCVATEIDFKWTYVGGSQPCIEQILADPALEALPTTTAEGNAMGKGRGVQA